jgi:hypothetical protein
VIGSIAPIGSVYVKVYVTGDFFCFFSAADFSRCKPGPTVDIDVAVVPNKRSTFSNYFAAGHVCLDVTKTYDRGFTAWDGIVGHIKAVDEGAGIAANSESFI